MSIGYAYLQQVLDIEGKVVLRADLDFRITNIENMFTSCGYDLFHSKYTEDTIIVNIDLPEVECTLEYDVTVTNNGLTGMKLMDVTKDAFNNNDIEFVLLNIAIGDVIDSGDSLGIKILFRYITGTTNLPPKTDLSAIIKFSFEEYIPDPIVFLGGLAKHVVDLAVSPSSGVFNEPATDWRYQGINPDNYLLYNNELWRIIGVFSENTHGISAQKLIKIIKATDIGGKSWNPDGSNDWQNTALYAELNGSYLNGIHPDSKNMIAQIDWKVSITVRNFVGEVYADERVAASVLGYIGMMYASDALYSAPLSTCSRLTTVQAFNVPGCQDNAWLIPGYFSWVLNRIGTDVQAWYVGPGGMGGAAAHFALPIHPALYLKANVQVISGSGNINDPFIIGQES